MLFRRNQRDRFNVRGEALIRHAIRKSHSKSEKTRSPRTITCAPACGKNQP